MAGAGSRPGCWAPALGRVRFDQGEHAVMIEFKAECGHTVRAKDEDAGGAVRCSYCGCKTSVPDSRDDELDFLFDDVQPSSGADGPKRRRKRWGLPRLTARRRGARSFDPFAIVFRMCYAAVLIIIVVFVARRYVLPLFEDGGLSGRLSQRAAATPPPRAVQKTQRRGARRKGLMSLGNASGLYVGSTPVGAQVFCVEASKAPETGRVAEVTGCTRSRANGPPIRLGDGVYVVDVVLRWNDPALTDPDLPYYQQYRMFRRAVEHASDAERIQLVEEFFVPDEASAVFVTQTEEQIYYLVRQYRHVRVRGGRSTGVRALFLPRIVPPGRDSFAIAQLVTDYIPKERAYQFDEKHVREELDYHGVPDTDRLFVVEALARIGVVPYVTPDKRTLFFKIGIYDGEIVAPELRTAER